MDLLLLALLTPAVIEVVDEHQQMREEMIEEIVEDALAQIEEEAEEEAEEPESPPESGEQDLPSGTVGEPWQSLADCESGNWIDGGASFERNSARWYWAKPGTEVPHWGTRIHHGGLQFHPGTWSAYRSDHHPQYAYDATPAQQVEVAQRVQASQGWGAWPTCSKKIGLR